ncbi:hypothetical protein CALVIDRAFT_495662 [Calocera viscosa TUFC12733]|uniref:HECT-type E3 ubiquitin transferase n=1 Tax=Calocera viscosa (strain TUFC12733) TaxID=1330018 RepID=A0A167PJ63_CALVF|nr:hypothetical protein CALVIDRAFT_495662 [Calocera viscosa TUFC12733]
MKINKQPKRLGPIHPDVSALINSILAAPKEELPSLLSTVQTWQYPRCDLHAWSAVLNKFDEILEQIISDYEVDQLQINDFTPSARALLSEILRFERVLLDNSTNRKIYASYDRLNGLLSTTDLDVLVLTLKLFLRPAQQYSSQVSLSQSLAISTPRLAALCMRFPTLRDNNLELAALVSSANPPSESELPSGDLTFNFYKLEDTKSTAEPGLNVFHLPGLARDPRPTADIVAAAIEKYGVPDEHRFELLHRVRLARALGASEERLQDREKLAVVRLLSVAIFCHTHVEALAQNSLFLPDPTLISNVAECLQPRIPAQIQVAALAALDGLARYKNRITEVMGAINAGVSHGILMSTLRRAVAELEKAEEGKELTSIGLEGVEQLLSFVTYLASNSQGGNMIVGAGLIPLLVQIIDNKQPAALPVMQKTMALADNVLYGYTNAFSIWLNSRGLDVLVERIKHEVDRVIAEPDASGLSDHLPGSIYGRLPYMQSMALKNFLRSMHRMMQSSGTSEGLRSLIDSSLSNSVKDILTHRGLFGPHIFALSINIMATFIHNEPTSLGILQEQHVPETFYNAVAFGIEPVFEVIQAIPNAIGALCLNQAGQDMLSARPEIISGWFGIFTSEKHVRVLQDRENAGAIGTSIDELIRHHPVLKTVVMNDIKGVFDNIEQMANSLEATTGWPGSSCLQLVTELNQGKGKAPKANGDSAAVPVETTADIQDSPAAHDKQSAESPVMMSIDVLGRFMDGLFQHTPHIRDFISKADGVERICKLFTLPCLPEDFASSSAAEALVAALRLMAEVNPQTTLVKVHEQVRSSLIDTKDFWSSAPETPKLYSMASVSTQEDLVKANKGFRKFVVLLGRLTFMAEVYASISFSHGRSATTYLQTLASGNDVAFLDDLGALHRCCILENVFLKAEWPSSSDANESITSTAVTAGDVRARIQDAIAQEDTTLPEPIVGDAVDLVSEHNAAEDPRESNRKSIKHLMSQIPLTLTTFFQAIVKMFLYSRRNVDATQKKQASATASAIAQILVKHLKWTPNEDFLASSQYSTYATVMLGLITVLFFDERTSQNNLQTMLVVHFREVGGFNAIFDLCRSWASQGAVLLAGERNKEAERILVQVFGGLKVALNLFESLAASKPLFDSGQTALLTTRDKKPEDKDYFEPHDFLIKLRLEILPVAVEMWDAPWVVSDVSSMQPFAPPLGVIRSIVRIMQHIMDADGEERRVEAPVNAPGSFNWAAGLLGLGAPRPEVVPDENRVQQLIDMGFPRHAVERALRRTGNNVSAATEYLLTHPAALLPEPAPLPAVEAGPSQPQEDVEEDVEMENGPVAIVADIDAPAIEEPADNDAIDADPPMEVPIAESPVDDTTMTTNGASGETPIEGANHPTAQDEESGPARDFKRDLDVLRSALEPSYPKRALLIADAHESLIFEIKSAFLSSKEVYSRLAFNSILDDIKGMGSSEHASKERSLAVRCHLLALVLNQPTSTPTPILRDRIEPAGAILLELLRTAAFSPAAETLPKWLSSALLGIEAVLTTANDFTEAKLPEDDEPVPHPPIFAGPQFSAAYEQLFPLCTELLSNSHLTRDELISVLRLLVFLTRERTYSATFLAIGGLPLLLERFKAPTKEHFGCQIYLMLILRHLVEDEAVLQLAMKDAVVDWFHQPRNRVVDASTLLKNVYMVALRDPERFLDAATSVCQLQSPAATIGGHHISLRPSAKPKASSEDDNVEAAEEAPKALPSSEPLEAVVSYLVGELLEVGRVSPTKTTPTESKPGKVEEVVMSDAGEEQQPATPTSDPPEHIYICELMSWLTELVTSYAGCKVAFVNHGKKRAGKEVVSTPAKSKPTVLNFMIQDLLFAGSLNPKPFGDTEYRLRAEIGIWAMSLVTALCRDEFPVHESKELHADLTGVRKAVLDAVTKAIRETMTLENQEAKYDKLHAIADLCHHLLVIRPGTTSKLDDASIHIAKLMLERNFVSILTSTLADVDLNYPHVKTLINAILRPLEQLTRVAIKMGRASEKERDREHTSHSPHLSTDQPGGAPREETPDLYRNSALGIFGGEMDEMYDEDDLNDEDEDAEDEEMEVEFEDDETDGSDLQDEEDIEDDEVVVDEEQMDGSVASEEEWEDENDDEEMVEEEEGTGDEDDSIEGDEEAEDEEEEMMWEENAEGLPNAEDGDGEDAEDEGGLPVQLLEDDVLPNDDDDGSEVADFNVAEEIGLLEPQFVDFGGERRGGWRPALQAIQATAAGGDLPLLFPSMRRGRGADVGDEDFMGGRSRNSRGGMFEFPHPLLVDPVGGPSQASSQGRAPQRRGLRSHGPFDHTGLPPVPTLESLGDAVNMLGHLLSRGRGEAADVEFSGPLAALFGGNRDNSRHHSARRHISSHASPSAPQRQERERSLLDEDDFGATSSIHRWQEEAALAQGHFAIDRAQRLGNHLILRLLPAAREAAAAHAAAAAEKARAEEDARQAADNAVVASQGDNPEGDPENSDQTVDQPTVPEEPVNEVPGEEASTEPQESDMAVEDEVVMPGEPAQGHLEERPRESIDSANGVDASGNTAGTEEAAPGPSATGLRVTVLVHGNPVDITDTGIDPTFLEALPDDMREEVLNQHFREQRASIPQELPRGSAISAEFLDALPADIRAEILQQDAAEQRRAAREAAAAAANPAPEATGPVDMDAATFFATLDPQLRSVVLLEQDDGLLQTLPSSIVAEANDLRALQRELLRQRGASARLQRIGGGDASDSHKKTNRDAIQLLDKTGIATLVRLLFYPQLLRKNYLHKILVNICENGKTRAELINLLLNILQDGTGDLVAVDKAFAQLSVRTSKSPITPKSATKQKSQPDAPGISFPSLPAIPGENVAGLIAQRSIEALSYIVNANEQAAVFFLTEQETPLGLRRSSSKKGKGKERPNTSTKYPIVVLLGLLDRPAMLGTGSLMDAVAALLALITRPLTSLDAKASTQQASASSATAEDVFGDTATQSGQGNHANATAADDVTANEATAPAASGEPGKTGDEGSPPLLSHPPQIPHHILRLIVNILTVGECSSRTFQQTLALISHLSHLPDAKDVVASELKSRAQSLGSSLFADLDELANVLEDSQADDELRNAIVAKFSPASSDQAKLLRILKTIDYMFQVKKSSPNAPAASSAEGNNTASSTAPVPAVSASDSDKVYAIYEGFRFTALWKRLGDCLAIVEDQAESGHIATVLLPLIESLMVVCKYVAPKQGSNLTVRMARGSMSPQSPITPRESMEDLFVSFTDAHRKMLNVMVRNNPSLMSGSFALLVQNPRVLDFDNKRNYFSQQLHKRPHSRELHQTLQLNIRRARVFEDSFQYLQRKTGDQIKYGKLSIRFYDEEGVDAGGVTREWFQILARQMFNADYALFQPCAADRLTYQPNRASWINPEHLLFFKFVGRIIGKAIYDGRLLDAHFARSFYRQLLGKPVDYRDVEWVDPEYYNSLCWILENDPTVLDLNFSLEADEFGQMKMIPLKPEGDKIPVTNENKREYVQLAAQHRLVTSIKDQIDHLLLGFFEIIPKDLITIFNEQEVELLISGTPDIDVDEWRAATDYNGYVPSEPVIVWWWRALKSFSREERAKMLAFVTGTSRVPLDGFNALQGVQGVQRFSIHKAYGDSDRLPQAHTCFNQIDLPSYTSYEKLRTQLLLAINEGGEGFGFA